MINKLAVAHMYNKTYDRNIQNNKPKW